MSRNRHVLTLKEKIDIVEFYEKEKLSVRDLAKRFNIGKTQSARIIKNRVNLLTKFHKNVNVNEKRSFLCPVGSRIDKLTFEWFTKARSKGIPVSGPIVQAKAKDIAQSLGQVNFKASSGWLERFRKRHNIAFKAICGEAATVKPEDVEAFMKRVSALIKNYSPKDILNADETGLFFRAIPTKTLTLKGEKCIGGKMSKERVTILLCANMAGEKERLFMIGKAKKPRAFKNLRIEDLPVTWKSNKKAWMTSVLMEEWLLDLDRRMGREKRNILLFLDNASSHPKDIKLKNIKIVFLPPNCTSVAQPLDQGIIQNFKVFYRANLLNKLLSQIDSSGNTEEVCKALNVLDAVYFAHNAWQKVTENTIKNCFLKSGIQHGIEEVHANREQWDEEDDIPLSLLRDILGNCQQTGIGKGNLKEYFKVDENLLTEDVDEESQIVNENSIDYVELVSDDDSDNGEDAESEALIKIINYKQALAALKDLQEFVKTEGDSSAMNLLTSLEVHFQEMVVKNKTRQTFIDDFFCKE